MSLLSASAAVALPQPASFLETVALIERTQAGGNANSQIDLPASSLAAPPANMALKYVTLGFGTQNYTCAKTPNDANSAPASNGAHASLYDAAYVLTQGSPSIQDNTERILPSVALTLYNIYGITPDQYPAQTKLKQLGTHYFTTSLVPTFDLHAANPPAQIQGKKTGDVPAPSDACQGINGEGAVDWLQLTDNASGYTNGTPLNGGLVYRVETAGGVAPKTCAGQSGDILVRYAAEYFFYGPSS